MHFGKKLKKQGISIAISFNSIINENFELLFGDCGNIYFYIKKSDLVNKNFEGSWAILQC